MKTDKTRRKSAKSALSDSAVATTIDCMEALKALADPSRLKILNAILADPATVSSIAKNCDLTDYNASRHLSILHRAGLVDCQKDGQRRFYRISNACEVMIDRQKRTLDLKCCQFRLDTIVAGSKTSS